MSTFNPRYLVLHDYGGTPQGDKPFNPYHTLVMPDGRVIYRNPESPYSASAPHAYHLNSQAIGLAYGGPVGSKPTPEAMAALRAEAALIKSQFPSIERMGHGEAYARRGEIPQASKNGRDLIEASWRTDLDGTPEPSVAPIHQTGVGRQPAAPVPLAQRSLVAHAGLKPAEAPSVPSSVPPAMTPEPQKPDSLAGMIAGLFGAETPKALPQTPPLALSLETPQAPSAPPPSRLSQMELPKPDLSRLAAAIAKRQRLGV